MKFISGTINIVLLLHVLVDVQDPLGIVDLIWRYRAPETTDNIPDHGKCIGILLAMLRLCMECVLQREILPDFFEVASSRETAPVVPRNICPVTGEFREFRIRWFGVYLDVVSSQQITDIGVAEATRCNE